jgi:transposase
MPDYQAVYDRLNAPGSKANLFYLWLKYKKDCPSGYQYTQFCEYFKRFVNKRYGAEAVSMVVERIPGEKVYIDWIGDQPEILVDSFTGEISKVHFFVTTVGVSNLVYAEAFEDEKLPNFIAGTVHALDSYGAVPKYLVPDNLKTAITRHTRDELVINSAYQDLESFYDVVILPPPPRKPNGKPTVEKYVQFLETHLLEDLKEKVYYNIEDINYDVWICTHRRSYADYPRYITKQEHMAPLNLVFIIPHWILFHFSLGSDQGRLYLTRYLFDFLHVDRKHPVVTIIVMKRKFLSLFKLQPVYFYVGGWSSVFRLILVPVFTVHPVIHTELVKVLMYKIKCL